MTVEPAAPGIARRVAAMAVADLPAEALHWAKVGILDYLAVTLAGCREPAARIVAEALGAAAGPSVVFGTGRTAPPLEAALVNGTAAHALDFDDISNTMGGHPSAPVLSALFALADREAVDGRRFLLAYIAGFEVETKLAAAVHFHHYRKGWHPTATLGVFGAAAACGKLMGLDEAELATALAVAASFASGVKANFGTMAKPMHVGHAARQGLFAAELARRGFTASPGAFEHKQGFFNVYNGEGTYDPARIFERWAAPLDIVAPGIAIKRYPCCGSIHPALDAMLTLVEQHDLAPGDIAHVDAWLHERRLEHTDRPYPASGLDAKFSLQYGLARAITDRAIRLEHFEDGAYNDAATAALLPLIAVAAYDETRFPADQHFGAEVEVRLRDGQVVREKVRQARGRTSDDPLPPHMLHAKFVDCARGILPEAEIEAIPRAIAALEQLADLRILTGSAAGPSRRERVA